MHALLREPALHFLLLGALLFAAHAALGREPAPEPLPPERIEVDAATLSALDAAHVQRTGAPPTLAERAALLEAWLEEEVLVREALALGLERSDPLVRERLVTLMTLVLEEAASTLPEPDDATLLAWMREHEPLYAQPERVSLSLATTPDDAAAERLERRSATQLTAALGRTFAQTVAQLPPGHWSGPHASARGELFVRVDAREPAGLPPLDTLRDQVLADWLDHQRTQRRSALARRLLETRYEVVRSDGSAP